MSNRVRELMGLGDVDAWWAWLIGTHAATALKNLQRELDPDEPLKWLWRGGSFKRGFEIIAFETLAGLRDGDA